MELYQNRIIIKIASIYQSFKLSGVPDYNPLVVLISLFYR